MRIRSKFSPLVFVILTSLLVLFTIYSLLTPRTYSVPHEQHVKPLWQTWQTSERYRGGERERWDGTAVCKSSPSRPVNQPLKFREDGSFRIAVFTDIHFSCGHKCGVDHNTQLLMDSILEMERPDLVVFNGDLIQSEGGNEKPNIFLDAFASVEHRNIPFAVIFGNHDSDGPAVMTREALVRLANRCPHSITMSQDEFVNNQGSYIRTLEGKTITQLLFLETNRDIMTQSQEKWLRETMDETQNRNDRDYLSTLVFMQKDIPSKEFVSKMCARDTVCNGLYGERMEYGGKGKKNDFYRIFQGFKGEVRAIISGHDHKNDLCSAHQEEGGENPSVEVLCYARASGYGGYGHDILAKGARIIHINENTHSIFTYVIQETGERGQMLQFIYPK